jgi:hypothetical protein
VNSWIWSTCSWRKSATLGPVAAQTHTVVPVNSVRSRWCPLKAPPDGEMIPTGRVDALPQPGAGIVGNPDYVLVDDAAVGGEFVRRRRDLARERGPARSEGTAERAVASAGLCAADRDMGVLVFNPEAGQNAVICVLAALSR